jgi:pyridoxamine 5'-phosphate oxidase
VQVSVSPLDRFGRDGKGCDMTDDPFSLFESWFAEAKISEPNDPNGMALATTGADGQPHARMVLLKGHGPEGFIFYTNQQSDKANQIAERSFAALLFHWKSLRRQVRIEGKVLSVDAATADAYFSTRGRDSQLGAWASDQSRPLASRETFEARFAEMEARFAGGDVPRPPHWSGYCVYPNRIEFWQDRAHRLHERRLFTRNGQSWDEGLLYP